MSGMQGAFECRRCLRSKWNQRRFLVERSLYALQRCSHHGRNDSDDRPVVPPDRGEARNRLRSGELSFPGFAGMRNELRLCDLCEEFGFLCSYAADSRCASQGKRSSSPSPKVTAPGPTTGMTSPQPIRVTRSFQKASSNSSIMMLS